MGLLFLLVLISVETVKAEQNEEIENYSADFVSGQVIIGMKSNSSVSRSGLNRSSFPGVDVANVEVLSGGNANTRSAVEATGQTLLLDLVEDNKQSVLDAIDLLEQLPDVAFAEPDYLLSRNDSIESELQVLNPLNLSLLWNMEAIWAAEACQTTRGDASIKVGVIDTGIDHTHPNLAGRVDTTLGYNFVSDTANAGDSNGHGTNSTGLIGASGSNAFNMSGVAPDVTLVSLKVSDGGGTSTSIMLLAIEYATRQGLDVISHSWSSQGYSQVIENAIRAFNGLFVTSAGSDARDIDAVPVYPASLNIPHLITVGDSTS